MKNRNNEKGFAGLFVLGVLSLVCVFGTGSQISFGEGSTNNMSKTHSWGGSGNKVDAAISWLKGGE